MPNATVPFEVNLGPSYGPITIGAFIEVALWGMTTAQTVMYLITYGPGQGGGKNRDHWYHRLVVLINFILTTTLVIAITSGVYLPLILHFGNTAQLKNYPWGIRAAGLLSALTIFNIHCFFLVRVYRFSKTYFVILLALPFVLATFALGLVSDVQVIHDPSRANASKKLKHVNTANEAIMAVTDFLLAALLTYTLKKKESKALRGQMSRTSLVVDGIIRYTIGTGLLTGLLALIGVILPFASKSRGASIGLTIYAAIPHTYSNAMLIILNSRKLISQPFRDENNKGDMSTLHFNAGGLDTGAGMITVTGSTVKGSTWNGSEKLPNGSKFEGAGDLESGTRASSRADSAAPELGDVDLDLDEEGKQ